MNVVKNTLIVVATLFGVFIGVFVLLVVIAMPTTPRTREQAVQFCGKQAAMETARDSDHPDKDTRIWRIQYRADRCIREFGF